MNPKFGFGIRGFLVAFAISIASAVPLWADDSNPSCDSLLESSIRGQVEQLIQSEREAIEESLLRIQKKPIIVRNFREQAIAKNQIEVLLKRRQMLKQVLEKLRGLEGELNEAQGQALTLIIRDPNVSHAVGKIQSLDLASLAIASEENDPIEVSTREALDEQEESAASASSGSAAAPISEPLTVNYALDLQAQIDLAKLSLKNDKVQVLFSVREYPGVRASDGTTWFLSRIPGGRDYLYRVTHRDETVLGIRRTTPEEERDYFHAVARLYSVDEVRLDIPSHYELRIPGSIVAKLNQKHGISPAEVRQAFLQSKRQHLLVDGFKHYHRVGPPARAGEVYAFLAPTFEGRVLRIYYRVVQPGLIRLITAYDADFSFADFYFSIATGPMKSLTLAQPFSGRETVQVERELLTQRDEEGEIEEVTLERIREAFRLNPVTPVEIPSAFADWKRRYFVAALPDGSYFRVAYLQNGDNGVIEVTEAHPVEETFYRRFLWKAGDSASP